MIKLSNTYPRNKEHYIQLLDFSKKILSLCSDLSISPIAYGSLIYFAYTKDPTLSINDIDFLVTESEMQKLIKYLEEDDRYIFEYYPTWHTMHIEQNHLKIELDSIDFWQKNRAFEPLQSFQLGSLAIQGVSLNDLMGIYKVASEVSVDNPEGNRVKYLGLVDFIEKRKEGGTRVSLKGIFWLSIVLGGFGFLVYWKKYRK